MKYTWILFDADGTLFDYEAAEAQAIRATFEEMEEPFLEGYLAAYRLYNGQVWAEFEAGAISALQLRVERFRRMFAAVGISRDAEAFSRAYLFNLGKGSNLITGAEELVKNLRPHFRLGLITNGLSDVQRPRLAASPIADCFDLVAVSEEMGAAKPHADFFDRVFTKIGRLERSEVLVVGDGLTSDIQGGVGYGLDTCWFNPRGIPADPRFPPRFEVRSLAQVEAVARRIWNAGD